MKILSRYILKQYSANLLLGLAIFTFILLLDKLFELMDLLLHKGVGLWLTAKLLALLLPSLLSLTLPISCLLATMLTFGHLSETSEVTAVRASGIHPWRLVEPPLLLAASLMFFLVPFNTYWAPKSHQIFRELYVEVLQRSPLIRIEQKTFLKIQDYNLYVEKKHRRAPHLRGVTIYKTPQEGAPLRIFAESGDVSVDPERGMKLTLEKGRIGEIRADRPERWFYTTFQGYELFIPFDLRKSIQSKLVQEMTNSELKDTERRLRGEGKPVLIYQSERSLRIALAITPALFVLFAVPLAAKFNRGGRGFSFMLGILVTGCYYVLTMASITLAHRDILPPAFAVWIPNLVLGSLGIYQQRRFVSL